MQDKPHRIATPLALLGCGLLAGCAVISELNPLNRGPAEPLPPVTGNVIATSSSRDLEQRLGTAGSDPTSSDTQGATDEADTN